MCPRASGARSRSAGLFTAGERIVTAECSFAVEDIDAHLLFFRDPEGNVMGAAQYDPHSTDE